jgi:hypothetical protein
MLLATQRVPTEVLLVLARDQQGDFRDGSCYKQQNSMEGDILGICILGDSRHIHHKVKVLVLLSHYRHLWLQLV